MLITLLSQLHGALQFDCSMLIPNSDQIAELASVEEFSGVVFRTGQVAMAAKDIVVPFARVCCCCCMEVKYFQ